MNELSLPAQVCNATLCKTGPALQCRRKAEGKGPVSIAEGLLDGAGANMESEYLGDTAFASLVSTVLSLIYSIACMSIAAGM